MKRKIIGEKFTEQMKKGKEAKKENLEQEKPKKLTRGQACKLMCYECMGYDGHRTDNPVGTSKIAALRLVKECESTLCPMYNFGIRRKEVVNV